MRKLYLSSHKNPEKNLAWEQELLRQGEPAVLLWSSVPAVIVGCNQIIENEIDLDYAGSHNIAVARRITGGGAIYMDRGNINICFIARTGEPQMAARAKSLAGILNGFGVPAIFAGRNDIMVAGRKVSGWAETMKNGFSMAHGAVAFDIDLTNLERVLRPAPHKLAKHAIHSVRERVVNLSEFLPQWSMERFITELTGALQKVNPEES